MLLPFCKVFACSASWWTSDRLERSPITGTTFTRLCIIVLSINLFEILTDYVTFPVPPTSFLAASAFTSVLYVYAQSRFVIILFCFFILFSSFMKLLLQYSWFIFWGLDIKKPCMKKHSGPRLSQLGCCVKPYAWTEVFLTCTMECMVGEKINHLLTHKRHFRIRWLDKHLR